jgi:hypothetical protein
MCCEWIGLTLVGQKVEYWPPQSVARDR